MIVSCAVDDCEGTSGTAIPFCARHMMMLTPKTRTELRLTWDRGYYVHSEAKRKAFSDALAGAARELCDALKQTSMF